MEDQKSKWRVSPYLLRPKRTYEQAADDQRALREESDHKIHSIESQAFGTQEEVT